MSEYYERGCAVAADATSFDFFVMGFLAAGAFGWPALCLAFELGAYDRDLAVFVWRVLGGELVAGLFGYGVGALAGRVWQALHQWRGRDGGTPRLSVGALPAPKQPRRKARTLPRTIWRIPRNARRPP